MKAFIYTGGEILPENITERPAEGDLVIAADCGLQNALRMGVAPTVVLGDFDSLPKGVEIPEEAEILQVPAEKDETDTQLAVSLAISRGAREIVIIGGIGGRLDHTLSNLAILEDLDRRMIHGLMVSGYNRARFLRNNSTLIPGSGYRYLALIAADPKVKGVSAEGVKYPLKKATLERCNQYAVSNEIVGNCALIDVRRGGAWIVESKD